MKRLNAIPQPPLPGRPLPSVVARDPCGQRWRQGTASAPGHEDPAAYRATARAGGQPNAIDETTERTHL
jgi:hypothetical protein